MLSKPVAAAAAAVALLSFAVVPARAEPVKNVVLVHGAFADGSGWRDVADILVKDDFLYLDPAAFPADFAADVPPAEANFMAHSQAMLAKAAGGAPVTAAAWHQKKSWALIATSDHNINPDLERKMAKRAGSETIEVPASHAVYVSKPKEVAALIERAAKA